MNYKFFPITITFFTEITIEKKYNTYFFCNYTYCEKKNASVFSVGVQIFCNIMQYVKTAFRMLILPVPELLT